MSPYSVKEMPENFGIRLAISAILAKNVPKFVPIALHYLFCEKDTTCDAITENNFLWQHCWTPLRGDNFDMSFTAPIVYIKLVSAFNHRHSLSKIEKVGPIFGHLCIPKGKM